MASPFREVTLNVPLDVFAVVCFAGRVRVSVAFRLRVGVGKIRRATGRVREISKRTKRTTAGRGSCSCIRLQTGGPRPRPRLRLDVAGALAGRAHFHKHMGSSGEPGEVEKGKKRAGAARRRG
jgi:hypothetical protein